MENCVLIIFGVTSTGEKFRPSDWIERFCGVWLHMTPLTRLRENELIIKRVWDTLI